MGRHIGRRVIQACETVESFGACESVQVVKVMGVDSANVRRYLRRAVEHGLLTTTQDGRINAYRAVTGWRDKIGLSGANKPALTEDEAEMFRERNRLAQRRFKTKRRAEKYVEMAARNKPLSEEARRESIIAQAMRTPNSVFALASFA